MIELVSSARLSPPTPSRVPTPWVLSLSTDTTHRIAASGVPLLGEGPLSVFVDGVLFDRAELAAVSGASVRQSDAELLLAAFLRRGDALIGTLRGSFVIVLVDRERDQVSIIRDPIGSHPAFHTTVGRTTLVATSAKALLAQPGVSGRLNAPALADHCSQRWAPIHETYFEAIRRLPPGNRMIVGAHATRIERHWNRFEGPVEFLTEAESDRFDERLSKAVERCFGSGRLGVYLSGGFDSVSVAAVAVDQARQSGSQEPLALSLGFPHMDCDERLVQTGVARQLGMPLDLMGFMEAAGPRGLLGEGLALNERLDGPLGNTWFPAYLTLAQRGAREGVRTILTGEGGDEWLNVSPLLSADLIRRGDIRGLYNFAETWHRSFHTHWARVTWSSLWEFGLKPLGGSMLSTVNASWWDRNRADRCVADYPRWVAPDAPMKAEQRRRAIARVVDARPAGGFYARELRNFIDDPVMARFFEEQHELGTEAGVRYQHPYWDPDLVEHMYRTPPSVLTRGNRTKALVRAAIDRRFPGFGFKVQRKVLALNFFATVALKEARAFAPRFRDFTALGDLRVVEPAGARECVDAAFRSDDSTPRTLVQAWRLITLESWARAQRV